MSIRRFMVHDVVIVRPALSEDRHGDLVKDWGNATRTEFKGWMTQDSGSEDPDHREAQIGRWTLYLPSEATITGVDRVEWDDKTFEAIGPGDRAWTPRGEHHVEAALRLVEG